MNIRQVILASSVLMVCLILGTKSRQLNISCTIGYQALIECLLVDVD